MSYTVKLTYFKAWNGQDGIGGKYYAEGDYASTKENLWEIFEEVIDGIRSGKRPGLVDCLPGENNYHALIRVPDHPHDHPYLYVEPNAWKNKP